MIQGAVKLFRYYQHLGEMSITQLSDEQLFVKQSEDGNSVANIVKHLWGNMKSRWTDFLDSDGEKEWRERDAEFEDSIKTREEMMTKWEEGWQVLYTALEPLDDSDIDRDVFIRGEKHRVEEAVLRQLAHYAYHVGQIVFIARNIVGSDWQTLSIAKGQSKAYNREHVGKVKESGESIWGR